MCPAIDCRWVQQLTRSVSVREWSYRRESSHQLDERAKEMLRDPVEVTTNRLSTFAHEMGEQAIAAASSRCAGASSSVARRIEKKGVVTFSDQTFHDGGRSVL
jgi:hypothetical protein